MRGAGAAGECDAGADDADNESADAGTGDSRADIVSAEGRRGKGRGVFEGIAGGGGGDGVGRAEKGISGN